MNTISMNSKNSKICDPHRIDEKKRRKDKYIPLLNLSIYYI